MAMYNVTLLQQSETVWDLFYVAGVYTGGKLLGLFMVGLTLILLMIMKKYDAPEGALAVSFIMFILSAILTFAKLLSFIFPLFFLAITAFVTLYVFVIRR